MKLIFCTQNLPDKAFGDIAQDSFVYVSMEDYTVGPLSRWPDLAAFRASRAAYFETIQDRRLPDGRMMEYFEWVAVVPEHKPEDYDSLFDNALLPDAPEVVLPEAQRIEIWHGGSVRDTLCLWHLLATFALLGITRRRIFTRALSDRTVDQAFLEKTRIDVSPARPLARTDFDRMRENWTAVTAFVETSGHQMPDSDSSLGRVLSLLKTRFVDTETGLNRLHERLILSARVDWMKMGRVIAETMALGYAGDDPVGDWVLRAELAKLQSMTPVLALIDGDEMWNSKVRLTPEGDRLRQALVSGCK